MNQQAEIDAAEFERRITNEPGTVVLDVRSREEFGDWSVDAPEAIVVNLPEAEVKVDPANGSLDGIDGEATINVLCGAGNASRRVTERLLAAGRDHEVLPLSGVTHMTPQEVVAENLLLHQLAFLRRALGIDAR